MFRMIRELGLHSQLRYFKLVLTRNIFYARLAQMEEQGISNPWVESSSLSTGAIWEVGLRGRSAALKTQITWFDSGTSHHT